MPDINYIDSRLLDPDKGAESNHHAPCDVTGGVLGNVVEMTDFQERKTLSQ